MIALRSLVYVLFLYGSMALVGLICLPASLIKREWALWAPRLWVRISLWGLRWIVGARVLIEGAENIPEGPVVVASKHQAMLDTMTPFLVMNSPSIVLKRELLSMPVFGWFAQRSGMIAIDRDGHASALKGMLRDARARAAEGRPIIIYPEGTRQEIGAPTDYKPGVAALYRDLGAPCVPVAVSTGLVWSANGLIRRPGTAVVRYLPPIAPGLSRNDFMRELETRIETATSELVARGR